MQSLGPTDNSLEQIADPSKSAIENLLKVYETDRELFFRLPSLLNSAKLSPTGRQVAELAEAIRTGLQVGYTLKEEGDLVRLMIFDPHPRNIVSIPGSIVVSLRKMLVELDGSAHQESPGRDYTGSSISQAEFDFRNKSVPAWDLIARELEEREARRPTLVRLDDEEIEDLKHKPKYVLDELLRYGRPTVFNPSCVFTGIRETGRLKKRGFAYCAKPEGAAEHLLFAVFADEEGFVFDWGWVEEDRHNSGFPCDAQSRFHQSLPIKSNARLVGTDQLKHDSFRPVTAVHSTRGDCILFYFNDSPSFMRRINDDLTLLIDRANGCKVNGFKLKNISRILLQLFAYPETACELGINLEQVQTVAAAHQYVEISVVHTLVCSQQDQWPKGLSTYIELQTALIEQAASIEEVHEPKVKVKSAEAISSLLATFS